ncbi:MAG: hypothetical protein EA377_00200 [Phycisphaerales bacterium]|nr:MAG: hypothetical protein EA377_00200 [Phycisphaerales bacterium]
MTLATVGSAQAKHMVTETISDGQVDFPPQASDAPEQSAHPLDSIRPGQGWRAGDEFGTSFLIIDPVPTGGASAADPEPMIAIGAPGARIALTRPQGWSHGAVYLFRGPWNEEIEQLHADEAVMVVTSDLDGLDEDFGRELRLVPDQTGNGWPELAVKSVVELNGGGTSELAHLVDPESGLVHRTIKPDRSGHPSVWRPPGDLIGDGRVTPHDIALLSQRLGRCVPDRCPLQGDLTRSGRIELADITLALSRLGTDWTETWIHARPGAAAISDGSDR